MRFLIALLALVPPGPGRADPGHSPDTLSNPVMTFATCAGRYSAEVEHRWLMGRDADQASKQRRAMVDLVDAVRLPDQGPLILALRIEAKMAQAALLQRAEFNPDPAIADRALRLAQSSLRHCSRLLPGV
ncbi:hypothetical protein [Pseudooceanicola sp. MF1-13]|uniref:hypothetical protein n=1 Tax=Pseudooceanicola sp. MF1-13 TaxID=3379095 RepID=UPI003891752D